MSVRLSAYVRDHVVQRLMNRAFDDRAKELEAQKNQLAFDVRADIYPQALLDEVEKIPEEWVNTDSDMRVSFGGEITWVYFGKEVRLPKSSQSVAKQYPADHPLTDRYRDLESQQDAYNDCRREAKANARATLRRFTTVAALLKGWPEVAPFLPEQVKAPDNLPVVQTDVLNRVFRLPAETQA